MRIKQRTIRLLALAYLFLPTAVFLVGMVKPSFALPCLLGAAVAFHFTQASWRSDEGVLDVPWHVLTLSALVLLVWCVFGGQGELISQTKDWNYRNAVFHDLLDYPWPVRYANLDAALCYYFGHWLVPAGIAKGLACLGCPTSTLWRIGNVLLAIWTFIGVLLAALLLSTCVRRYHLALLYAVGLLVFFGGMDCVGCLVRFPAWETVGNLLRLNRMDTWAAPEFEFSCPTTLLFWAFNQAVPAWVATLLLYQERSEENYGSILAPLAIAGPFPFVGLGCLAGFATVASLISKAGEHRLKSFWKHVFSVQNVLSGLFVILLPLLFLMANSRSESAVFCQMWDRGTVLLFALFLLVEVGIVLLCVAKENFRSCWFWGLVVSFVVLPMVDIGVRRVFGMRATIPALTILLAFVLRGITEGRGVRRMLLFGCLLMGLLTSLGEFLPVLRQTAREWPAVKVREKFKTFDRPYSDCILRNFWALEPAKSCFFRYFAKEVSRDR